MNHSSILGVQVAITSGCALYYKNQIVFAISEERCSKIKNETIFPHQSIQRALQFCEENDIPLPQIAVFPSWNLDFEHYLLRRECTFSIKDYLKEQHDYWYKRLYLNMSVKLKDIFPDKLNIDNVLPQDVVKDLYQSDDPKVLFKQVRANQLDRYPCIKSKYFVNHEYAHAAYALYGSPLTKEDALIIAIDGFGDDANASVWTHDGNSLICHKKYTNFNVGRIYRYITLLLGMKPNEHEHKVMGLAAYADPKYVNEAVKVFENTWYFEDGEVKYKDLPKDSYFYFKDRLEGVRFDSIAGALQKYTENMILDLVRYWAKKLNKRKITLSGGVSLNIKANMMIGELDEIDDIFVPASGGDESLCIGAIFSWLDENNKSSDIQPMQHMYLGNAYSINEIEKRVALFIKDHEDKYEIHRNITTSKIAQLIADGKIIGRFAGRMEFGARALGNRSIIANPNKKNIVRMINAKIKKRDFWMPFTTSVLDFKAVDYLINPKKFKFPFMTIACKTTTKAQNEIFGALHSGDFTTRPQIVTQETNPSYWELINEFYQITGIGALLNTSLNLSGLPICESPEDVFHVLVSSDIDGVVLENTLILKTAKGVEPPKG
ncbi:carbamoyltransferase [Candidatus Magnetomorum sp. HK-1]|nr:carbamoyltransferase [Candidatus Magnetomorum sp. HK-1]